MFKLKPGFQATLSILAGCLFMMLAAIGIMSSTLSKSKHVFQMGAYIE